MLLAILAALTAAAFARSVPAEVDPAALIDGDLVLHTSRTPQARAIVWATASPYAHVGIVERRGDAVHVLEAVQPVRRTAWSTWRARGLAGHVTVLRHPGLDADQRAAIVSAARHYLGRPYDLYFAPGEDRIYCSELVHLAYAAIGVQLGAWTPASELGLSSAPVQALLRERWRGHPSCAGATSLSACMPALAQLQVITPVALRRDTQLRLIASSYPISLR